MNVLALEFGRSVRRCNRTGGRNRGKQRQGLMPKKSRGEAERAFDCHVLVPSNSKKALCSRG